MLLHIEKALLHTPFLLVFKLTESLQCILKENNTDILTLNET